MWISVENRPNGTGRFRTRDLERHIILCQCAKKGIDVVLPTDEYIDQLAGLLVFIEYMHAPSSKAGYFRSLVQVESGCGDRKGAKRSGPKRPVDFTDSAREIGARDSLQWRRLLVGTGRCSRK